MSRRNNPFEEIERLFEQMSSGGMGGMGGMGGTHDVSVDVSETDAEVVVTADLPGYEKEDIEVGVKDRRLTVEAERSHESEDRDKDERFLRQERTHRRISRSVSLPADVDEDATSATYRNGVLTVTLPKVDPDEDDDSHIIDIV